MLTRLENQMVDVFASQVDSPQTIDTVTDADAGQRQVSWGATDIQDNDNFAGKAKSGTWVAQSTSTKDPAGQYYEKLTDTGTDRIGYYYLNRQFDASQSFTVTGYLKPDKMPTNGGGGLGIQGIKNAFAMGLDFYNNANFNDPGDGPKGVFRWTGTSGSL
ncbi:hypothetical protein BKY29_00160 [Weissella confusa]|uniref:hypothetical protein n=1 Tax=Weissella confusa TaxID=1583 RepID=UPI0008FDD8ED|nr:hypothetical protein [Weissella confusa]OJF04403.1 hypothetical protein BKY29_00160 [Weissella confusa]